MTGLQHNNVRNASFFHTASVNCQAFKELLPLETCRIWSEQEHAAKRCYGGGYAVSADDLSFGSIVVFKGSYGARRLVRRSGAWGIGSGDQGFSGSQLGTDPSGT